MTALLLACDASSVAESGDAARGRVLLHEYGCGNCHHIPGVHSAHGTAGPPLDDVGRRLYLAGTLSNSPENMMRWIRAPEAIKPQTAMPNLQVSESDAHDMVAHLYRSR